MGGRRERSLEKESFSKSLFVHLPLHCRVLFIEIAHLRHFDPFGQELIEQEFVGNVAKVFL